MEKAFWDARWTNREIAFHLEEINPLLLKHFQSLSLNIGSRVLVPLCGKTRDIGWLLEVGCEVVGIEFSQTAVEELFSELKIVPERLQTDDYTKYSSSKLTVFMGDFFKLSQDTIGLVDAVYDRAALVALPHATRREYSKHVIETTNRARQLLIGYEYDQSLQEGPPFAVLADEIEVLYGQDYNIARLEEVPIVGGLKKKCAASEVVWLLKSTE